VSVPVAVVGVGNMGRHHARNYHELAEADLRAVVDADVERAREAAQRFGAAVFPSVAALLEGAPEVEAVSVAVPTSAHCEVAGALLDAGKHVLVEKPIAPTIEEADELIHAAQSRSLVLAVGHVERFNPAVRELRRLIDDGRVGSIVSLVARRVGVTPPQVKDANVIVDLAVHDIDIFGYLLEGAQPTDLYCNAGRAIAADRFDFADVFLRYGTVRDAAARLLPRRPRGRAEVVRGARGAERAGAGTARVPARGAAGPRTARVPARRPRRAR
jgi:UDP-N-acetylglucosamine 3-dehydrogenase